MGFPGAYGAVFPIAVFRIALLLIFIKESFVSVANLLLGRGWESPYSRMYTLGEPLDYAQSDAPEYDIGSALDAAKLAAEIKASLPVVPHREIANKFANDEEAMCSVCLCDFTPEDGVRQAPQCSHVFHKDCLDRWMAHSHTTCPLCRSNLTANCLPEQKRSQIGRRSFLREYWDGYPSMSSTVH